MSKTIPSIPARKLWELCVRVGDLASATDVEELSFYATHIPRKELSMYDDPVEEWLVYADDIEEDLRVFQGAVNKYTEAVERMLKKIHQNVEKYQERNK